MIALVPATHVHPLFALPFRRLGLPASALTLGAMAPDVAYAIGAPWWGQHDPLGIFTFALPVGLLALWLYEVLIAPALGFEATALDGGPRRWALVVVAIVVGACTHVFVDGFTHYYGWAAIRWPVLRERTLVLPTYRWLQYGASAVGSVVLLYAGRSLLPRLLEPRALAAVAAITTLSVGHGASVASGFHGVLGVRVFMVRAVAGALVLVAGALVANGVWYRLTVARGPRPR